MTSAIASDAALLPLAKMQAHLSRTPGFERGDTVCYGDNETEGGCSWALPHRNLCNLWLARAFNAQDVEAAAAMYHPDASIVQVDQVHGGTKIARGAEGIRETMAAYIGMKPHMDVITTPLSPETSP